MEFIDLKAQYSSIKDDVLKRIEAVLEHGHYILGPEVNELEQRLASYVNRKHCISCANGTDALLMALMALGVGRGDAVFTTCLASWNVLRRNSGVSFWQCCFPSRS